MANGTYATYGVNSSIPISTPIAGPVQDERNAKYRADSKASRAEIRAVNTERVQQSTPLNNARANLVTEQEKVKNLTPSELAGPKGDDLRSAQKSLEVETAKLDAIMARLEKLERRHQMRGFA